MQHDVLREVVCMQGALYIGGDINICQCTAALDNIMFAEETHAVHIVNSDVTCKLFNAYLGIIPFSIQTRSGLGFLGLI